MKQPCSQVNRKYYVICILIELTETSVSATLLNERQVDVHVAKHNSTALICPAVLEFFNKPSKTTLVCYHHVYPCIPHVYYRVTETLRIHRVAIPEYIISHKSACDGMNSLLKSHLVWYIHCIMLCLSTQALYNI